MAGTIKTPPATAAFRTRCAAWPLGIELLNPEAATLTHEDTEELEDAVSGETEADEATELVGRVECAYCGRTDLEAGQQCACLDRASGAPYGCRRCGRPTQHVGELCDGCEWEHDRPRRERAARAAGLLRG